MLCMHTVLFDRMSRSDRSLSVAQGNWSAESQWHQTTRLAQLHSTLITMSGCPPPPSIVLPNTLFGATDSSNYFMSFHRCFGGKFKDRGAFTRTCVFQPLFESNVLKIKIEKNSHTRKGYVAKPNPSVKYKLYFSSPGPSFSFSKYAPAVLLSFFLLPRSHLYWLSLALCMQWYNGLTTPLMHASVRDKMNGSVSL